MPTRRLSTGERFSNALPDLAATYSPLMKLRICFVMRVSPSVLGRFSSIRLACGIVLRFAFCDMGEELRAAICRRQSAEEEREAHYRLHLLPCRAGTPRGDPVERRRVVHVHQQHPEEHQLR